MQEDGQVRFGCGHTSHNHCIFERMVREGFRIRCTTCHRLLIPDAELTNMLGEDYNPMVRRLQTAEDDDVRNLLATNAELKATVKEYKKAHRATKASERILWRDMKEIVENYKTETDVYLNLIRDCKKRYMKRIQSLDSYRKAMHDARATKRLQETMDMRWNVKYRHIVEDILKLKTHRKEIMNPYRIRSIIRYRLYATKYWHL
jgi:hypothetical protein